MNLLQKIAPLTFDNYFPTGSRLFGDANESSDWDYVVLVGSLDDRLEIAVLEQGFEPCSESKHSDDDHMIVKRPIDNINLIITKSQEKFEMWRKCTRVSAELSLNKEQRKVLFSVMIDETK